ncbi:unnamed protein product [Heligmosomoides polygyrus]|uniref:Sushi domain-containing protein n=1 Tax=Heligmosomoides polygyrus TaxID=6339 RepID=A0A183FW91_HELPZ|nr:unnamed protein product [Heligmosomoides polygyrus]
MISGKRVHGMQLLAELCNSADCDSYQLPKPSAYDNLTYWWNPDQDNKYQHGTYVTLSCSSGPVVDGASEAMCSNGEWLPKLGRCPTGCDPYRLRKPTTYDKLTFNSKPGPKNTYQHGTHVSLSCSSGPVIGQSDAECNNGQWLPQLGRCPQLCLVTSELHITIDEGEEVIAVLTRNHLIPLKLEEDNGGSDINGDEEIPSSNEAAPRYNLRPRQTSKERQKHRPAGV